MKATELRIGNYISPYDMDGVVRSLNRFMVKVDFNYSGEAKYKYEDEGLKPIPLTEEWLVKFKIHKDYIFDNKYNRDTDDYLLYIEGIASCNVVNWDKPIKYVHEAQNLYFALTGEELEIKQNVTENV